MPGRVLAGVLCVLLLTTAVPASALEKILSFHSAIDVAADASMTVRESIRALAEGNLIRRGIYREFPTTYHDRFGNLHRVKFDVLEVTRNGKPEPWHTETRGNGVRVYAGDPDVILDPGKYDYSFTYRTDRQIGFFDGQDELYWNVTGNGWDFIIDRASATVTLPGRVDASDITMSGYTGPQGATGDAYVVSVSPGRATIQTQGKLAPREGLTLAMGWPKGVVAEPGGAQKILFVLQDNFGLIVSLIGLLGSVVYLSLMWIRFGRDPKPGVIFPHYEPPGGYSPAAARYIYTMAYDNKAFTAAIINLAVKGYLSIACDDDEYTLTRLSSKAELAPGEAVLMNKLFTAGAILKLENTNHELVAAARIAHMKALRRDYLNTYFKTNSTLLLPSFVGSAALLVIIVITNSLVPMVFALYGVILVLHLLFLYLMKAPSQPGRKLMDKLEGFRLYLEVAEKDDLNLQHPPDLTPALFEQYLPFAIALGVEQKWAQQFSEVFAKLEASGAKAYTPVWYHGDFSASHMSSFASNISGNFSSAISSAASPPGSSSGGGGGGSSGGGGGGGGGGGW